MRAFVGDLRAVGRFAAALPRFVREPIDAADTTSRIAAALRQRTQAFLTLVQRAVFEHPGSPYRPLFEHAQIGPDELATLVSRDGVEGALHQLYDGGVHLKLDEFKGRQPIRRGSQTWTVRARDFDNPLATADYEASTGGTRGRGTRLIIDLDLLRYEACYEAVFLRAFDAAQRPMALWRPVPPGASGLKTVLRHTKLGHGIARWFSQIPLSPSNGNAKYAAFTYLTLLVSRRAGAPVPRPEYVPITNPLPIVRWLAERSARKTPALVDTPASCGVRICLTAMEHKLDIGGTLFRLGGECYSPGKARIIEQAGCHALVHYAMAEAGRVGIGCPHRVALDDVHLLYDKLGIIQRRIALGGPSHVGGIFLTTLLPASPKVMINVEVGDYGVLEEGPCDCPLGRMGLSTRLHTIRSYEKLTSEGMHFIGNALLELVETVLPARFGGHATDYQLVEHEEQGLSRVGLMVSPRVGAVDEAAAAAAVFDALVASTPSGGMMARFWRDGGTLRIIRGEPYTTSAAKIQPLHVVASGLGVEEPVQH